MPLHHGSALVTSKLAFSELVNYKLIRVHTQLSLSTFIPKYVYSAASEKLSSACSVHYEVKHSSGHMINFEISHIT